MKLTRDEIEFSDKRENQGKSMQKHKRIIEKKRAKHISIKSRETIKQRKTVLTATAADNIKDGSCQQIIQRRRTKTSSKNNII